MQLISLHANTRSGTFAEATCQICGAVEIRRRTNPKTTCFKCKKERIRLANKEYKAQQKLNKSI